MRKDHKGDGGNLRFSTVIPMKSCYWKKQQILQGYLAENKVCSMDSDSISAEPKRCFSCFIREEVLSISFIFCSQTADGSSSTCVCMRVPGACFQVLFAACGEFWCSEDMIHLTVFLAQ